MNQLRESAGPEALREQRGAVERGKKQLERGRSREKEREAQRASAQDPEAEAVAADWQIKNFDSAESYQQFQGMMTEVYALAVKSRAEKGAGHDAEAASLLEQARALMAEAESFEAAHLEDRPVVVEEQTVETQPTVAEQESTIESETPEDVAEAQRWIDGIKYYIKEGLMSVYEANSFETGTDGIVTDQYLQEAFEGRTGTPREQALSLMVDLADQAMQAINRLYEMGKKDMKMEDRGHELYYQLEDVLGEDVKDEVLEKVEARQQQAA